ncbi:hypothetical protein GN958_ATG09233 [Phytophthora infestans]|uniref:Uncharacterized protein n=1 Tax=Phytophthora infestans TaxID=4787 RepID=A0A8S9UL06_PHYIN|nr:hypothetical protein GN958_ATG09233 [Phytophthora infestans]
MRLATSFARMRALERPGDSAAALDKGSGSSMTITSLSASLSTRTEGIGRSREREKSPAGAHFRTNTWTPPPVVQRYRAIRS